MNRANIYKQLFLGFLVALVTTTTYAQNNNLSLNGKVIDAKYKTPLAGATVHIKGTTHEVSTDLKGNFQFVTGQKVPVTYIISYVGYETEEVLVTEAKPITVTLKESSSQLNDVVVIGYGTQKRKELTGSVASVPKEAFDRTTPSFDNLLQGAVAGVAVSSSSGQPGATASIRIRGGNSLSFGNDPLYVIDGFIEYNNNNLTNGGGVTGVSTNALSTINPSDIESIDILKDAAATAIYGGQGANGVVIITTKRGKKGADNVSYSASYGTQQIDKKVSVLNGPQWASYYDDLVKAAGLKGVTANQGIIDSLGGETGQPAVSTDWASAAIKSNSVQNHQLSINGGDEKSRYSLSGNYFNQDGIVLGTNFTRETVRSNYERNISSKLKINSSILASSSNENKLTGTSYGDNTSYSNAYSSLYFANPLQQNKNSDGSYFTTYQPAVNTTYLYVNGLQITDNPINDIANTINNTKINRVLGNFSAEYKLLDGLVFKTTLGADILNTKLNSYAPSTVSAGNSGGTYTGVGSVGNINYLKWLNENTLTYDFKIQSKHYFTLLGGYTTSLEKEEYTYAAGENFPTDALTYNNLGLANTILKPASAEFSGTRIGWLGRANYSFDHKYNFSLSAREDGASNAGVNKKWGFFPAAGFSWNVSDEEFLKKYEKTISNLKVRLTTGSTGNTNYPAYSSLATINANYYYLGSPLTGVTGLSPTQSSNPDLTWETTTQSDAGIDVGFFKNRINLTADYYYKKTTNLYISAGGLIPLSTGYTTVNENIGSLENKGFELSLNTENIRTKDFSWHSTIIYSHNANKILSLGRLNSFQPTPPTGQIAQEIIKVGLPVGTFWGYSTNGLLTTADRYGSNPAPLLTPQQTTGDRKYVHANGQTGSAITLADKHSLGNAQAKFTGSFNNTFNYKQFDLSVFFQGSFGNKIFNLLEQQLEKTTVLQNVSSKVLNRWDSLKNPTGTFQKLTNAPVMQVEDTYVEDGSYIRLKTVTLGYNFPKAVASKIWAKQIRLYVTAQNLLTITKYTGADPEANFYDQNNLTPGIDYGVYPRYKSYLVGLNVTF